MKKLLVSLLYTLMLPLLIVVIVGGAYFYTTFILPIQKNIHFAANYERSCNYRADPIRVRVGSVVFKIPANIFKRKNLTHCWGGSGLGPHWGCVKGQESKIFEDNEGNKIEGFCQTDSDNPFRLEFLDLDFTGVNPDGLVLTLEADSQPDIRFGVKKLRIHQYDHYFTGEYCRGFGKDMLRATEETMDIIMFGNPVYVEWHDGKTISLFTYKAMLGHGILLWGLDPSVHKLKNIPSGYWPSYFSQLEGMIQGYIVESESKLTYKAVCSGFGKVEDGRAG